MSYKIDNPAGGNCGFYSFAIGLIHIIQTEYIASGKSKTFNSWQQNGLKQVTLQKILDCKLSELKGKPRSYQTQLLNNLQSSLRDIFLSSRLTELKDAIHSRSFDNSDLYQNFCELVNFYLKAEHIENLTEEKRFNTLAFIQPVQQLAQVVARDINDLELEDNDSIKEDCIMNHVQISLIQSIEQGQKELPSNYWATEKHLSALAEVFNVRLDLEGHHLGNEDDRVPISLENIGNFHWVTVVPSLPTIALKSKHSETILPESNREIIERVIQTSTENLTLPRHVELYKSHLKTLMEGALNKGLFNHIQEKDKIALNKIDSAVAAVNERGEQESDEKFAEKLQEAEIRRVLR